MVDSILQLWAGRLQFEVSGMLWCDSLSCSSSFMSHTTTKRMLTVDTQPHISCAHSSQLSLVDRLDPICFGWTDTQSHLSLVDRYSTPSVSAGRSTPPVSDGQTFNPICLCWTLNPTCLWWTDIQPHLSLMDRHSTPPVSGFGSWTGDGGFEPAGGATSADGGFKSAAAPSSTFTPEGSFSSSSPSPDSGMSPPSPSPSPLSSVDRREMCVRYIILWVYPPSPTSSMPPSPTHIPSFPMLLSISWRQCTEFFFLYQKPP